MQKEIRVENVKITVFGQIIEIEPLILKVDAGKDMLDGFGSLEKAYEEGAYIQDYVMDKFWNNVYIKGTPKFVDVEKQKEQDKKACNLYLK